MQNDTFSKWELFITSYLPLYIWLMFSVIDYHKFSINSLVSFIYKNTIFYVVLVILTIVSIQKIIKLFKINGSEVFVIPKTVTVLPESDSLMNYIVTYFTPLLSFDLSDNKSVAMNAFLFLLIGLMYVGSSASYLNPVLGVFGFKIFGVSDFPNAHHIISNLSFDEIETSRLRGDKVIRYRLGDGIYIIKRK